MERLDSTDRALPLVTSCKDAYLSLCLIRSHADRVDLLKPLVRTSTQEPFNFEPCNVNLSSPFLRHSSTSGFSDCHVPRSHTITVPPPYCPSGMMPSNPP